MIGRNEKGQNIETVGAKEIFEQELCRGVIMKTVHRTADVFKFDIPLNVKVFLLEIECTN